MLSSKDPFPEESQGIRPWSDSIWIHRFLHRWTELCYVNTGWTSFQWWRTNSRGRLARATANQRWASTPVFWPWWSIHWSRGSGWWRMEYTWNGKRCCGDLITLWLLIAYRIIDRKTFLLVSVDVWVDWTYMWIASVGKRVMSCHVQSTMAHNVWWRGFIYSF